MIAKLDKVSLLEIEMGLVTPDIVWIPELGSSNTSASVRDMFNKWIRSYLEIARLVKRLDIGEGQLPEDPPPTLLHQAGPRISQVLLRSKATQGLVSTKPASCISMLMI